jgi:hypothetical protein
MVSKNKKANKNERSMGMEVQKPFVCQVLIEKVIKSRFYCTFFASNERSSIVLSAEACIRNKGLSLYTR